MAGNVAFTSPVHTFTVGETVTAATLNTHLRDNTTYLYDPPMCLATRATGLSCVNATVTPVLFNTADKYDTDTMHDIVTNAGRITANTAGVYSFYANVAFAAAAGGVRYMWLSYNGVQAIASFIDESPTASHETLMSCAGTYKMAATDYVECQVYQNSGSSLSLPGTNTSLGTSANFVPSFFGAQWMGAG